MVRQAHQPWPEPVERLVPEPVEGRSAEFRTGPPRDAARIALSALILSGLIASHLPRAVIAGPEELDAELTEYFRAEEPQKRAGLLARICSTPSADVPTVAARLGRLQLWKPVDPGAASFELAGPWGPAVRVQVRLPQGYDPARRYPLILALHGQGGKAGGQLQYVVSLLKERVDEFIIAAPDDYQGTTFGSTLAEADQPSAILREVGKRYHVDSNRVYVSGYSMGGHGSFHTATLYRDWFASAIPLAGTFPVQGIPELDHELLPNLAAFPMLVVWGELDTWDENEQSTKSGGIAGINRRLRAELPGMGVTGIEFIELAGVPHKGVLPPRDRFLHYVHLERGPVRRTVDHMFRYPVQGRAGWLRQKSFAGEPWEGTQLVIKVKPGEDLAEFARRTVRSKLAFLKGNIEGQQIHVTMQRLTEAEVVLNDELIDLDLPITVYRGKKVVFEGTVQRSVATLLETAYADWDFQRLFSARILVPSRGKVRGGEGKGIPASAPEDED